MNNFTFYCPTKFVFGKGQEENVGKLCREQGATKVLIVYGGGSVIRTGLLDRVRKYIQEAGIETVDFGGAQPNPRVEHVREGIEIVKREGIDFLLAIGGGSVIDTAKGIGIGALYDGDVWDYFLRTKNPTVMMPVGVIVTIAASGSEGSSSCVLNNDALKVKSACNNDCIRPRFAIMNPELTYSLPAYQTACGVVDIMMHTHERYFTPVQDNEFTDEFCEGLLRTMIKLGPKAISDPTNYNVRAQIMWAGVMSHNNTVGVGRIQDSACHRMQVMIGAKYDSAHGAGLATVCPAWMKYVYKNNMPRFIRYATKVWGVDYDPYDPEATVLEAIRRLKEFNRSLGMPVTIEELGVKDEDIDELCQLNVGHMQELGPDDIRQIYELMR